MVLHKPLHRVMAALSLLIAPSSAEYASLAFDSSPYFSQFHKHASLSGATKDDLMEEEAFILTDKTLPHKIHNSVH